MTSPRALWLAALLVGGPVPGQERAPDPPTDPLPASPTQDGGIGDAVYAPVPGWLSGNRPGGDGQHPETERAIERARETVRELQARGGAYASGLADALLELGLLYRRAGQHEQALRSFREALQVARVNHGLHNLRQVPYLEQVVAENATLGRWDRVVDNNHYLYWIHKRNYGDRDPRLLPVIERVALAPLSIQNATGVAAATGDLRETLALLDEAVEIIELHYSDDLQRMADALYLVARSNYGIALQTGQLNRYRRYTFAGRSELAMRGHELMEPFRVINWTEGDGRRALERIEQLYEQRAPSEIFPRAQAIARQGDWRQLYGNGTGRRYYEKAYRLLGESENGTKHIARLFGQPRLLPAMDSLEEAAPERRFPGPSEMEQNVVEMVFDVHASGRANNVKTRSVPQGLKDEAARLKRRIIETWRFRPRMENGDPVTTRMVQRLLVTDNGRIVQLAAEPAPIKLAEAQ